MKKILYNHPKVKLRRQSLRLNETEAEKMLWSKLRGRKLGGLKFFRQYGVGPYILDFYCPKQRLAIEVDGGHHSDSDSREYDQNRSAFLESEDIKIIRFWNYEVLKDIERVLAKIIAK